MRRALVIAALILGSVVHAHADYMQFRWHDTIRPHGHKRGSPIAAAITDACDRKFGVANMRLPPGYKKCMQSQGYRFVSSHLVRTRRQPIQDDTSYDNSLPSDFGPPSSPTPMPDTTPVPSIVPDPPAPVDIHPFCPNPIC
jgi:hypothetical protein